MVNSAREGHEVHVLALRYPGFAPRAVFEEASAQNPYGRYETAERFEREFAGPELEAVTRILGIKECVTWRYQGNADALFEREVVDRMVGHLNTLQPDIVVTHWPIADYSDFVGAGSSVLRAIIEHKLEKIPQVFFSETLTGRHSLCFHPDTYVDITDSIAVKKEACAAVWQGLNLDYFFYPFAAPIAQFRGRECGVHFAEAYTALHGPFGVIKRPLGGVEGMRPETMSRAISTLPLRALKKGVHPASYGKIAPADAFKVFGI